MLPLLLLALAGCSQQVDMSQEKSPDAGTVPTKNVSQKPTTPGGGFTHKAVGSDTGVQIVK
ncbi:MAG TPA: hypothetical protein VG944_12905 [Fimbriimonas sp.]|nr:hypothetical protein [Fimbriimonas sp.]